MGWLRLFGKLQVKGRGSLVSEPDREMARKRKRDADGNVILYPSDLKKRPRTNRSRPAWDDGRENAQKKEARAAASTDEAVEQLRAEGLQKCADCCSARLSD